MKSKNWIIIVVIVVLMCLSAVVGGISGGLVVYSLGQKQTATVNEILPTPTKESPTPTTETSPQGILVDNTDIQTTISGVVQDVGPAVVTVVGTSQVQFTPFGGLSSGEVSGSGVFISPQGYIITNHHVIENTTDLWVILSDGTKQQAQLVGTDIYADLAVLKTDGRVPAVAVLGNSDVMDPGETVIAIGSPLGQFTNSVTVGVVSATGRSIDTGEGYQIQDLLQTDAAINQGNSGGPLVNLAGEVIGINTLVVRSGESGTVAEGLGFAIPSNAVAAIAEQIIATGHFNRPYIGIEFQNNTAYIARRYSLNTDSGVIVIAVASNSPAEQAGLKIGDIILQIGETALDEQHSYINTLFQYEPGDQVIFKILRDGETLEESIVLGTSGS